MPETIEKFSWDDLYAYAHGYHTGREDGDLADAEAEAALSPCSDRYRYMFRRGYDAGVADYAEAEMAKWKRERRT